VRLVELEGTAITSRCRQHERHIKFVDSTSVVVLSRRAIHSLSFIPSRSQHEPETYVRKVMDIVDSVRGVYPFETFLTRWCGSATLSELKRGNVAQFLAWALLSQGVEDLLPRDYTMIMRMVDMIDQRYTLNLEQGLNTDVRTLRMTLEPLEVIHRPLCVYLGVTVIPRLFGNCVLRLQGFERLEHQGLVYWYRPSREWPSSARQLPLVFFHGVSPGQCAYAGLTTLLSEGRSAVLVEIPHIAMSLEAFRAKTEAEVTEAMKSICARHHIRHFTVAGHSYGTIWAGWVLRAMPKKVMQAVLLDPVCILLCLPNTPFNFLYRLPHDPPSHVQTSPSIFTAAGIKKRILDYGLHYVVSRELTIANAMRRQFWWHQKILHAEDIHCPVVVGLASDDILLSAPAIRKYLQDNCSDLDIIWWQDFSHGEILTSLPCQHSLDQAIRAQEERYYHRGPTRPYWEYLPGHGPPAVSADTSGLRRCRSRSRRVSENLSSPFSQTSFGKHLSPLSPSSSSSASSVSGSDVHLQRQKERRPRKLAHDTLRSTTVTSSPDLLEELDTASSASGAGLRKHSPSDEQRRRWYEQQDREREHVTKRENRGGVDDPFPPQFCPPIPESEPQDSGMGKRTCLNSVNHGLVEERSAKTVLPGVLTGWW